VEAVITDGAPPTAEPDELIPSYPSFFFGLAVFLSASACYFAIVDLSS